MSLSITLTEVVFKIDNTPFIHRFTSVLNIINSLHIASRRDSLELKSNFKLGKSHTHRKDAASQELVLLTSRFQGDNSSDRTNRDAFMSSLSFQTERAKVPSNTRILTPYIKQTLTEKKTLQHIVVKGEFAYIRKEFLLPQCFQLYSIIVLSFIERWHVFPICFQIRLLLI